MKKYTLVLFAVFFIITLTGCKYFREILLAPPSEVEMPDGSFVATCAFDDIEYKYIYREDGVYQYIIDGVEQNQSELDTIQEQAFLHGESVENYLLDEYGASGCNIIEYVNSEQK